MTAILGFLIFALFIALIVGLVKPKLILRWTDKPSRLKVFGYWFLATILIGIAMPVTQSDEDKVKNNVEPTKQVEVQKDPEEEKAKQKEQLEREIKSVSDGIDFSTYRGTLNALQVEIVLFASWASIITEGEKSEDPEIQKLAKQLKSKVVNLQVKEFPKLRKEYSNISATKMWENDIEVTANGTNNKYINFSGGIFAANKNKQYFQNEVYDALKMFRFTQARYRWYKGADEYQYWTVYEGKDSDLVTIK